MQSTKLCIITLLMIGWVPLQAQYMPAKCLAGLAGFFAAMAPIEIVRTDYNRNRALYIQDQREKYFLSSNPTDKKQYKYWDNQYIIFNKRATTIEALLKRVHNFFGVNKDALDSGVAQYGLRAIATGVAALAATGIEYAIRHYKNM